MSLLQSLLFPEATTVEPIFARKVTVATPDDIGDDALVPNKRIRLPRGGGRKLSASGEQNIYFNQVKQKFYVLITHNGRRIGKFGLKTLDDAIVARTKLEAEIEETVT